MVDGIEERIAAVKQEIADLKQSQTSCVTNVEKDYRLLELEDELQDLKAEQAAAQQQD